ncbi:MAG TPA: site-specific integrase [Aquabacterium sp.]|nr:site-specific integrase [Aquabacterium sp.]
MSALKFSIAEVRQPALEVVSFGQTGPNSTPPRESMRARVRRCTLPAEIYPLTLAQAEAQLAADVRRCADSTWLRCGQPDPFTGPDGQWGWRQSVAVTLLALLAPYRASALGRVCWENIDEDEAGWAYVVNVVDKGGTFQDKKIAPAHWSILRPLLLLLSPQRRGPVFGGSMLNRGQVDNRFGRVTYCLVGRRMDGKRFTVHCARHSFGSHAYAASGDITAISRQLGHASVDTTARYYVDEPDHHGGSSLLG